MGMYCSVSLLKSGSNQAQRTISLEKAWHGLHYLLTGSSMDAVMPLGFLLMEGDGDGEEDFGPAKVFTPDQVKEIDGALAAITEEQLWDRYDPEEMEEQGVYPNIWDENEAELREEYLGYFNELKALVREGREQGLAMSVALG